ncbi:GNAT family N-acetyltransferase [Halobacillus kuroshimensis]|uniref:GNAT family N-acetyltransferase n=1 Tax=Halobacillus kuroshimensis TaxID=302481 RepID=UPI00041D1F0C|nr:GNAT family N-acetyltransferase [Halobacillus kuroshimensis]
MIQIRELEVRELHTAAEWLYQMNGQDRHYVAWMASEKNEIFEQIWTLTQFTEPLAYVAWEGSEIVGFLGMVPFFEQKFCRLLGPFALKEESDVIERLWDKASLTAQLHFDAVKVACYGANEELKAFAETHAFELYNVEKTLVLFQTHYKAAESKKTPSIFQLQEQDKERLDKLHPDAAYYTTEEMFHLSRHQGNYIWGYGKEGELAGYLYFETIAEGEEGEICFVNVHPSHRNTGIGTELMEHALQYAFYALELQAVTLSVRSLNPQAEQLYKAIGFQELNEIHAYQKVFTPTPPAPLH